MEDDEEIRSHPSPPAEEDGDNNNDDGYDSRSGSPSSSSSLSSNSNGRITVTVASSSVPQPSPSVTPISPSRSSVPTTTVITPPPPHSSSLTLALPIQNPRPTSHSGKTTNTGSSGGGREDCWSEGATAVLIDAWGERFMQLSRGNLKQKHWQEVAEIVSARDGQSKTPKTDVQCKNRIDTVKKKYKSEKAKISSGAAGSSNWRFFDQLDSLISLSASPTVPPPTGNQRVPVGIPVGRPILPHQQPTVSTKKYKPISSLASPEEFNQRNINGGVGSNDNKPRSKRPAAGSESPDSLPPGVRVATFKRKRTELGSRGSGEAGPGGEGKVLNGSKEEKGWGREVMELTRAILRFGEVYEQAEEAKLEQMVEMEKQRMKFAKELELQRMKFLMKTQLDLSRLRRGGGGVNGEIAGDGGGRGGGGGGGDGNYHSNKLQHRNIIHDRNHDDDNRNYINVNNSDSSN